MHAQMNQNPCYFFSLHTEYYNTFVSVEIDYETNITIVCEFHVQSVLNSKRVCSIEYKSQFVKRTSYSGTVILDIHPVQGGHQNFTLIATNGSQTVQMEGKFNISGTACSHNYSYNTNC